MSSITNYVDWETKDPNSEIRYGIGDDPLVSAMLYARLMNGERVEWQ